MQNCSLFLCYIGNAAVLTVIAPSSMLDASVKNLSVYLLLAIICLELLLSFICLLRYTGAHTCTQDFFIIHSEWYFCIVNNTESYTKPHIPICTHRDCFFFATPDNGNKHRPWNWSFCTFYFKLCVYYLGLFSLFIENIGHFVTYIIIYYYLFSEKLLLKIYTRFDG